MREQVKGTFDLVMDPAPQYDPFDGGLVLGRLLLKKTFHGELDATSTVRMLTAGTSVKGSAGYVAIELVDGKLRGRRGTFVLQHSGTMNRGQAGLSVTVVPDSGTGELTGLSGAMAIDIVAGTHHYTFDFALDSPQT
jgi:hypothetical protein